MPCYHPSKVDVERKLKSGTRSDVVTVPCGKCLGCRADQARQWAIRLHHHASLAYPTLDGRFSRPAWFLTLTYDDQNLPPAGALVPEDCQLFLKRLRKRLGKQKLSYYLCGEYGENTLRPHYHAVILGPDFPGRVAADHRRGVKDVWTDDVVSSAWPFGIHELSPVSFAACAYVAGYVAKKVKFAHDPNRYTRVDTDTGELFELQPEFSRMSRRPAIGRPFIERYWRDVYPRDYVPIEGKEYKPPRYYDRWMDQDHDPPCKGGCDAHRAVFDEVRYQRYVDAEEIGDEKLIMKEKVHRARHALYQSRGAI